MFSDVIRRGDNKHWTLHQRLLDLVHDKQGATTAPPPLLRHCFLYIKYTLFFFVGENSIKSGSDKRLIYIEFFSVFPFSHNICCHLRYFNKNSTNEMGKEKYRSFICALFDNKKDKMKKKSTTRKCTFL